MAGEKSKKKKKKFIYIDIYKCGSANQIMPPGHVVVTR